MEIGHYLLIAYIKLYNFYLENLDEFCLDEFEKYFKV